MKPNEYQNLAMKTEADQSDIAKRIEKLSIADYLKYVELNNGVTGLSDEVGELNSALKKWIEYGQELDEVNIKEEVGDCLWRLAQICNSLDMTLEECMEANIKKLQDKNKGRYKDGYSDEAAKEENRNRKEEAELVDEFGMPSTYTKEDTYAEGCFQASTQIDEASCMTSSDELTQEDVEAVNLKLSLPHQDLTITNKLLEESRPVTPLFQNGSGWEEPPEEDESELIPDSYEPQKPLHLIREEAFLLGLNRGLAVAKETADLMDGRERMEALKSIESRELNEKQNLIVDQTRSVQNAAT